MNRQSSRKKVRRDSRATDNDRPSKEESPLETWFSFTKDENGTRVRLRWIGAHIVWPFIITTFLAVLAIGGLIWRIL